MFVRFHKFEGTKCKYRFLSVVSLLSVFWDFKKVLQVGIQVVMLVCDLGV